MLNDNTILLVDEDRELCDALEMYLTRYGYDTFKTETGKAALSTVSSNSPSVVISGTQLQDMSGLELLHTLRGEFPQIPVVMIVDEGDIISGVVGQLAAEGVDFDAPLAWQKGSVWDLDLVRGRVVAGRYAPPPS